MPSLRPEGMQPGSATAQKKMPQLQLQDQAGLPGRWGWKHKSIRTLFSSVLFPGGLGHCSLELMKADVALVETKAVSSNICKACRLWHLEEAPRAQHHLTSFHLDPLLTRPGTRRQGHAVLPGSCWRPAPAIGGEVSGMREGWILNWSLLG